MNKEGRNKWGWFFLLVLLIAGIFYYKLYLEDTLSENNPYRINTENTYFDVYLVMIGLIAFLIILLIALPFFKKYFYSIIFI